MGVRQERGQMILTGKAGKSFSEKMKSPSASVIKKRDAFIKAVSDSQMVSHKSDGRIVLKNK